jgi:arginyl-tRNA synthetase
VNPVYYVQYAHARVCSVLEKASIALARANASLATADFSPLTSPYEEALLRRIADFPDEIALAARDLAPHLVTFYLKELAAEFHSYYNAEQFLVDDPKLRQARLALVVAVGQVIRNGLGVLGVSAPEKM